MKGQVPSNTCGRILHIAYLGPALLPSSVYGISVFELRGKGFRL